MDSWFLLFFFPRCVDSEVAGREEAKNLAGRDVFGLIQIHFEYGKVRVVGL